MNQAEFRLQTDYSAIIIVGAWNKNIFNPDWISKFLLPNTDLKVEITLFVDGSPKISTNKVRIYILGNKLNLVPLDLSDNNFENIQEMAIKIADYLPHTPVTAYGINFKYEGSVNDNIKSFIPTDEFGNYEKNKMIIKDFQRKLCLDYDDKTVNLIISSDNTITGIEVNFHFGLKNLQEFKEKMDSNNILDLKSIAQNVLSEIYQININ
ncbi:MAG: hypothetical protein H8E87_07850 [FCB group bacterium]|nr:hypothetical protein [FCB group bacterium]